MIATYGVSSFYKGGEFAVKSVKCCFRRKLHRLNLTPMETFRRYPITVDILEFLTLNQGFSVEETAFQSNISCFMEPRKNFPFVCPHHHFGDDIQ